MADIVISVAGRVAEYFVVPMLRPATRHARFLFCAGKIKRNLQSMKAELISKQESVKKQKHEALIRTEIIDKAVERWLNEVTSVMEEVEKLEEDMKEGSTCCWGWCSTLKGYHLCKEFAKTTETMKSLNLNGEFNPFSHSAPIQDIEFFSSENFEYFESTKLASKQLLEALRDDTVYMIGLYGMGGCGKTSLAKEVGKKAKELKLFDHVLFTAVSQTITVRRIQGEIADLLNFKFKSETEVGRARELSLRLQSGERILITLDDVWAKVELEDIGIPLSRNHNGCKVLLTTRRQQVCASIDCERSIPLSLLSDEEAWTLFQKNTLIDDELLAQEIVRECKGLPIAIVAMARSLKNRSRDVWNVTLHKLRNSKPIDVEENERDAYSCLELSYNYLRSKEAKLLLKLCSMFPEDHMIPLEDLFRYGIGLGICEDVDTFEVARSTVSAAIDDLIDSSLLLLCENYKQQKFFKIHDMVRDVSLWISSKEDSTIMVDSKKDFSAFAESIKDCYAVSFWYEKGDPFSISNKIDQFPQSLVAPKLQILLLHSSNKIDFSHSSFEGIKELKVMSVIHRDFASLGALSLPLSTQWFDNLHTLRLVRLQIGDISFVLNLRRLMILDLRDSVVKKLPNGIENMNYLKLMDLTNCKIKEGYYEVIGRCSQLEELYIMSENFNTSHEIELPYEFFLHNNFPKLQRYRLNVGQFTFPWIILSSFMCAREVRAVRFGNLNISNLGASGKDLLQRASSVCVHRLEGGGCKSFIPEFVEAVGTMKELTTLYLLSCSEIECIVDTTTFHHSDSFRVGAEFPKLVALELLEMDSLKEVICVSAYLFCIFEKLEHLSIVSCNKLTSLFPSSSAQSVLQHGTYAAEKEILPNLKHIEIRCCPELEYVFPISVAKALISLQELTINGCKQLKHIIKNEEEDAITTHNSCLLMFLQLKSICVAHCGNLECIFPGEFNLANTISDVFMANARQSADHIGKLQTLWLYNLPSVSFIWMGPPKSLRLKYLRSVQIDGCEKLKSIFSATIHVSFPELTELKISNCDKLEEIMANNKEPRNLSSGQACFPKLRELRVIKCNMLKSLFSVSVAAQLSQLEELYISEAVQLEQVFKYQNEDVTCNVEKILLPNLRDLTLAELPNFVDICVGLKLNVVKLQLIFVLKCPKFGSVYQCSSTEAPVINNGQDLCREVSFHHRGSTFEDEQEKTISPTYGILLHLNDFSDLMFIRKGSTLINFQNVVMLKIVACRKSKFIFPACGIESLPSLETLIIKDCEELVQVFGCTSEIHDHEGEMIELALPNLRELALLRLPNITDFGGDLQFQLTFQALNSLKVQSCPKFSLTTIAALKNLLPRREGHKPDTCNNSYCSLDIDTDILEIFYSSEDVDFEEESDDVNSDEDVNSKEKSDDVNSDE